MTPTTSAGVRRSGRPDGLAAVTVPVHGMTGTGCEATVEAVLSGVDGVLVAHADRTTETALVRFDTTRTNPGTLVSAINSQIYYLASADGTSTDGAAAATANSGDLAGADKEE